MQLDIVTRELIAIGASVTANCRPCLEYHVEQARQSEADEPAIREAIGVGRMVRKGAASKTEQLIRELTGEDTRDARSAPTDRPRCQGGDAFAVPSPGDRHRRP